MPMNHLETSIRRCARRILLATALLAAGCAKPSEPASAETSRAIDACALPDPPPDDARGIEAWCEENELGKKPQLGGADNPCAEMCASYAAATELDAFHLAGLLTALRQLFDRGAVVKTPAGIAISGCAAAATGQVAEAVILLGDPWCDQNPVLCALEIATRSLCVEVAALLCASTHPLVIATNAACSLGSIWANHIESTGFRDLCQEHINNCIPAPINHQVVCRCDRQEREGGIFGVGACAPVTAWSQIGTAPANCVDRKSDWLPVASPECVAANADQGWTYYQYTNCRMEANVPPNPGPGPGPGSGPGSGSGSGSSGAAL